MIEISLEGADIVPSRQPFGNPGRTKPWDSATPDKHWDSTKARLLWVAFRPKHRD
jgi:hypothetical protein